MKDYQEAFKQEFGIHFSESELQFALAFIEGYGNARELEGVEKVENYIKSNLDTITLVKIENHIAAIKSELWEPHLPDRPINSERD